MGYLLDTFGIPEVSLSYPEVSLRYPRGISEVSRRVDTSGIPEVSLRYPDVSLRYPRRIQRYPVGFGFRLNQIRPNCFILLNQICQRLVSA